MTAESDKCFELAIEIAKKAGEMIKETFYSDKKFDTKSTDVDLVTETDQAVEKMVFDTIREAFPDHSFIGEESTAAGMKAKFTDNPTWIIDPIDGTTNFVHSFPYVCISIGFTINKTTEFGVVYNPILNDLFTARRGRGAFLNEKRLHVSERKELADSLITTEYGSDSQREVVELKLNNVRKILANAHGIRSSGSAALNLAFVAQGSAEAYYEYGVHCWDYAAGELIVREAGGVVMDTEGGALNLLARRIVAACHENVARGITSLIQTVPYEHDCQ